MPELDEYPPSVSAIYRIIERTEPIEVRDIEQRTDYSQTTVRKALLQLREADLIEPTIHSSDQRRSVYQLA